MGNGVNIYYWRKLISMVSKYILFVSAILFFSFLVVGASNHESIIFTLGYDKGEIELFNYFLEDHFVAPSGEDTGSYSLSLYSCSDDLLHVSYFDFSLISFGEPLPEWFDDEGNQIYIPTEDEVIFEEDFSTLDVAVPYYEDFSSIVVSDVVNGVDVLKMNLEGNNCRNYWYLYIITACVITFFFLLYTLLRKRV
ncbi:MAG: hypothetical protein ACI83O_000768 [Patescibacteria group bacterium]|jgi:hypothetical protein